MDTSVRPPMRISQSPTYFAPGTPGQPTNMAHTPNNGQMHPQAQAQNQHPPPPQQQQQYPFPQTPLQNSTPPPSATMQHAPALPNHPQLSTPVPLPHAQAQNPRTHPVGYPPQVHIQPAGPTYAAIPNNVRSPMSAHSPSTPQPQYSTAQLAPVTSTMGPPTKPVERVIKEVQYDVDDSLAGTGIDLREEEQYQADYFARNITGGVNSHARTGFPAYTPGSSASFYGAGLANQQPVPADSEQQAEVEAAAAQRAWAESAKNLAATRSIELNSPFLQLGILHARAEGIAKKHNISLNLDLKTGTALKFTNESAFRPEVTVKTHVGPDGAMITTSGSFIPAEAALADQFALLALATSHRVRELIGDANQFAIERQRTSHFVPSEWTDAARLHNTSDESAGTAAGTKLNDGSGASPRGSLAKRSFDQTQLPSSEKQVKRIALSTNPAANAMRDIARETKSLEELRLRRRQKLLDAKNGTNGTVRAGSAAPGTPTALAPEPEKAPTKKELKSKNAAAKAAEFSNTLSANRTSLAFLGGKKKKYDWLSGGSAPSTPGRPAGAGVPGTPGTPGGAPGAAPGDNQVFVPEGRTRLGVWREDGEKGKNMQVRDLIFVLQRDGKDLRALQLAYDLQDNAPPPK